jgi:hypothetical protein
MSYLEMVNAPLPDMSSGIISVWFRDPRQRNPPPPLMTIQDGPEPGPGTGPRQIGWPLPVPPNTQELVKTITPPSFFFWSAYGLPIGGFFAGSAFLGPPSVIIPAQPPVPTDNTSMMLAFGNPNQPYDYCQWRVDRLGVIDGVIYTSFVNVIGVPVVSEERFPPPYLPYAHETGNEGKFVIQTIRFDSPTSVPNMVPQSFIGVDKDGYLIICLQTKTRADYKGYAYEMDRAEEMWGSIGRIVMSGPTAPGLPVPHPVAFDESGPKYWNGYQFFHKDISDQIMRAQPEFFMLGGREVGFGDPGATYPLVSDGEWHHLLFSFDIHGAVNSEQSNPTGSAVEVLVTTACKAWLAVDDKNYTGAGLQPRVRAADKLLAPQLMGTATRQIIDFGPTTSFSRHQLKLGPNEIVPQNVWMRNFNGLPKDGVMRWTANLPLAEKDYPYGIKTGDFYTAPWAAAEWTLFHGQIPGPVWPVDFAPLRPPERENLNAPAYKCSSFVIPTNGHPIGIPASARHLAHNTGIEMAELQIWANKTLDTGNVNNRRLFIDAEGKPVSMGTAAKALGEPDIKLHGSSSWKQGSNSGSIGVDSNGDRIESGQFSRVGQIDQYKPDPQLHK